MKEQVYKDPRPAEHFTRFHERVRKGPADWMYRIVRMVLTPYLLFFYRARVIDTDKIPTEGPTIIVPNHFSFLDHFFVAAFIRREVNFMAKSQLFKPPLQFVYTHGGVFPVLRGRRDEEAFKTARAVLARGGVIVMYIEGGRSRDRAPRRPEAGRRAPRSGDRRADRADGACGHGQGAQLEEAPVPEGDRAVRRPDQVREGRRAEPRPVAGSLRGRLRRDRDAVLRARGERPQGSCEGGPCGAQRREARHRQTHGWRQLAAPATRQLTLAR